MTGALFVPPYPELTEDDGTPLAGGSIEFYLTGTSTPSPVYSDQELSLSLGAVIDLNASGRPENGGAPVDIWVDPDITYKVVVKRSNGTTVRTNPVYRQLGPTVIETQVPRWMIMLTW
jgi:hypothetical protein